MGRYSKPSLSISMASSSYMSNIYSEQSSYFKTECSQEMEKLALKRTWNWLPRTQFLIVLKPSTISTQRNASCHQNLQNLHMQSYK